MGSDSPFLSPRVVDLTLSTSGHCDASPAGPPASLTV